jgi:hypothetical protein
MKKGIWWLVIGILLLTVFVVYAASIRTSTWGFIFGNITDQPDLMQVIGNISSSNLSGYAQLSGANFTGNITAPNICYTNGICSANATNISGLVPYVGATSNVDLGAYNLTATNLSGSLYCSNITGANYNVCTGDGSGLSAIYSGDTYTYITSGDTVNVNTTTFNTAYARLDGTNQPFTGGVVINSQAYSDIPLQVKNILGNQIYSVTNDGDGDGLFYVRDKDGTATIRLYGAGTTYFNGGNVGFGTTTPARKIHILAGASSVIENGTLFQNTGSVGAGTRLQWGADTDDNSIFADIVGVVVGSGSGGQRGDIVISTKGSTTATETTERLRIAGTGTITAASDSLIVDTSNVRVGVGLTPASKMHVYENTSTTTAAAGLTIEQAGTGDPKLQFLTTGAQRWVTGIDNSDSDKFKIGRGADWATGTDLTITTTGIVQANNITTNQTSYNNQSTYVTFNGTHMIMQGLTGRLSIG